MVRGSHWWNEPPLWAWIVMVVSAVALAVMLPFALDRSAPAVEVAAPAGTPSSEASPAPTSAAASGTSTPPAGPSPGGEARRVVVVGDGYTSGTPQGGLGLAGWPALLEERIPGVEVEVAAEVGAGYVAEGASGSRFGELADAAGLTDADAVVVFGSRDDDPGIADEVAMAARDLFGQIGQAAPDARLVVVGPVWPEEVAPAGVRNNRDVIREGAEAVGARFVDPLEEGWFVDRPELIGGDGVHPTGEGHAYLADLLEPAVRDALGG